MQIHVYQTPELAAAAAATLIASQIMSKPNTVLAMRRFKIEKGARYVVAEDVVTKGGRVQETIDLVKAAGGKVAGVIVLVDRSAGKAKFGRIPMFSLMQMQPKTWTAAECPMCKAGGRPVHPGS